MINSTDLQMKYTIRELLVRSISEIFVKIHNRGWGVENAVTEGPKWPDIAKMAVKVFRQKMH
jgi:hypothetical protein